MTLTNQSTTCQSAAKCKTVLERRCPVALFDSNSSVYLSRGRRRHHALCFTHVKKNINLVASFTVWVERLWRLWTSRINGARSLSHQAQWIRRDTFYVFLCACQWTDCLLFLIRCPSLTASLNGTCVNWPLLQLGNSLSITLTRQHLLRMFIGQSKCQSITIYNTRVESHCVNYVMHIEVERATKVKHYEWGC